MEAMRQSWTDDRLDDFRGEVNRRFDEMAADVNRRFDEVDKRLEKVDGRLNGLDGRFDALQRTLVLTGGGIIATLIAGILSLIGVAVL